MEPASKTATSSTGLEMFQKASLSLAGPESSKAGKAKQKRFLKTRSAGSKSKLGSRSSQAALRVRDNQVHDENAGGAAGKLTKALSAKTRVQDKLSALCQVKSKSSRSIAKRKLLGDQNVNLIQQTSVTASDLKRVLGHSPTKQDVEKSPIHTKQDKPVVSPPTTPPSSDIPMKEICANLSKGLHCDEIFPNSTYLEATKAEIRKIMKQSNPDRYAKLKASACGSVEEAVKLINNLHDGSDDSSEQFTIQGQMFSPNPMALLFPASPIAEAKPADPVGMNVEVDSSPYCIDSLQLDTASNCSLTPEYKPSDFIDLLDKDPTTTEFTDPIVMEAGRCWSMSPMERPKMFPHKLY